MVNLKKSLLTWIWLTWVVPAQGEENTKPTSCLPESLQLLQQADLTAFETGKGLHWSGQQQFQLKLAAPAIQDWFAVLKSRPWPDLKLHSLRYDSSRAYQLEIVVYRWPVWDKISIWLDFPQPDQGRLRLQDNWFPSSAILDKLEAPLKKIGQVVPLVIQRQEDALIVKMNNQPLQWKDLPFLPQVLTHHQLTGLVAPTGDVQLAWLSQAPHGDSGGQKKHLFSLVSTLCSEKPPTFQGQLSNQVHFNFSPLDLQPVQFGQEKLAERVESGSGSLKLKSQLQGQLFPFQLHSEGSFQVSFEQLAIQGHHYPQTRSAPFQWFYSFPHQLQVWPEITPQQFAPHTHAHQLALFIDGSSFFPEIKQAIAQARESVDLEIFVYYDGKTTRELARQLVLKALGLQEASQTLQPDPLAPEGIRVFVQHNHRLTPQGATLVNRIFTEETAKLLNSLPPAQRPLYTQRVQQQFQLAALSKGVALANHRKVWVIDGRIAYTGGINLGDHYLTHDSFHDVMIRVQGPAVREIHQELAENWTALKPEMPVAWNFKDPTVLAAEMPSQQASQVDVLLTDHATWEIEAALLKLIGQARQIIRIEHAYLYHEPVEQALLAALERGIKLEIIISEKNDEAVFEVLNPASVHRLMKAGKKDQVKTWLYKGKGGKSGYMAHTKFLSADGEKAIVGSANLIGRSLHSPFAQGQEPLLYNEELSLWIDDPAFVGHLDQALFEEDKIRFGQALDLPSLEALIASKGGWWAVMIEKLKGLLA